MVRRRFFRGIAVAALALLALLACSAPRASADIFGTQLPKDGLNKPNLLQVDAEWNGGSRHFDEFEVRGMNDSPDDCSGIATRADWTLPGRADAKGNYAWSGHVPEGETGFGPFELWAKGSVVPFKRTIGDGFYSHYYFYKLSLRIVQHNFHSTAPNGPCALDSGTQAVTLMCKAGNGEGCPTKGFAGVVPVSQASWWGRVKKATLRRNLAKGTATIAVRVPTNGWLKISGHNLKTSEHKVKKGKATAPLIPRGALRTKLRKKKHVKVGVRFSFAPTGGSYRSATRALVLRHR